MGTFYVAEGVWRDGNGRDLPDPTPLAVAKVRGGVVINPEGEAVPQGPMVRPDSREEVEARSREGTVEAGAPETPSGATPTGTEPKGRLDQFPEGGAPADAELPDVFVRDATPTDAMPLESSSPKMKVPP